MPQILLLPLLSCAVAPEVDTAACTNHFTVTFVDESGQPVPVLGRVNVDVDGETHGAVCMAVGRELDCNVGQALSDNTVTVDLMGYETVSFVLDAACDGEDVDAGTLVFALRDCPEREPVPGLIVDFVDLAGKAARPDAPRAIVAGASEPCERVDDHYLCGMDMAGRVAVHADPLYFGFAEVAHDGCTPETQTITAEQYDLDCLF